MKKLVILIGFGLSVLLSSCYRNSVCATYTYNDQPTELNNNNVEERN